MRSYYLCFLLYFLQGTVEAIPATMPYLYPELPPYTTLALFSMTDFPFSLKFLLCTSSPTQPPSSKNTPTSPMEKGKPG